VLSVDLIGLALSFFLALLCLPGPRMGFRIPFIILLSEIGRVVTIYVLGAELRALTVGGAFTQAAVSVVPEAFLHLSGLLTGALLGGLFCGRRIFFDGLLYALLTGTLTFLLQR
jgi:hypothetical protein